MQTFCLPVLMAADETNEIQKRNAFICAWKSFFPEIFLDIFFFWRGKKKWIFEMWNFLSCKIKTILFWHCQNEARWLDFSILSNVFSEQNTQLNQGEYAGSLFFFFVKQFCSPAPLFCCFYSIVKSLIWRQPKPNQSLTSPPAHSNQTPWEKWNFLGCYSGLFSQECFHTKGKTS